MIQITRFFVVIAVSLRVVCPQTWKTGDNGNEDTHMWYTWHWKKEIVAMAKDCIMTIKNKVYQVDQINYLAADDLRHQIGQTIGKILEIHRQQLDMFRRMKRRVENRFNWLRPELSAKMPGLEVDGVIEPVPKQGQSGDFVHPSQQVKPNHNDYKPQTYIVALEFITKKEGQIENLVKLLMTFVGEEEVGRFRPNLLPMAQAGYSVWRSYTTLRYRTHFVTGYRRQVTEDSSEVKQEELKAKMRSDYYKKNEKKS